MMDTRVTKGLVLAVTTTAVLLGSAEAVSAAYYPVAYLSSSNLLSGQIAVPISSFEYTASAIPAGSSLQFQFSTDNSNWYNSSGTLGGWDAAASGANTISLSTLGWSGGSFYYKAKFSSSGSNTPILDDIAVNYTSGNNYPPNQPSNSSPSDGNTAERHPTLSASAYSDTESDSHSDTQWQVDDDSDFSSPVWTRTAGVAETSTTVNSSNGTFANELAGQTRLDASIGGTTYYWRVRYSDGNWSIWSVGTSLASSLYYPVAYLSSANILSGRPVSSVDSFMYSLSAKPSGTDAIVQFSQDNSSWYNSSGVSGGTDTLSTGSNNTIGLSGLGWSGASFYYRIKMTSDGTDTPVLDDVSLVYTATAATWDGSSSNDWNTGANWDIGSAPGNYHDVVIPNGGSPVLSANEELGNLTIQTGGTLDLNGHNLTLNDSGAFSNFGTLRLHGSETLTSFTNDTDSGTVEYDGTGTYTSFAAGNSYYNISFTNSGNWRPDGNVDVDGSFTMTGGTFQQGTYRLSVAGNVTIDSGAAFIKSSNGSLLILNGDLTLENEAGANLGNVQIGTSPDTIALSGSLIADRLRIGQSDILVTNGYNVIVGTGGITNSGTIIASGGAGGTTSISTASGFVNHGTFTAGSSILTLSGAFTNKGTFTANTGSVVLNGTNQTLSGSTTFYDLTKTVTNADTLTFRANDTFTISNALTLQGAASNLLSLRSSASGTQWKIDPQGTRTVSYLDVRDSNNTNATAIDATDGTNVNSGNNTRWQFSTPAPSASSEEATTPTTPSGGSRGGHDSESMQRRIAAAHAVILARYEGKRAEEALLIAREDSATPEESPETFASDEERQLFRATGKTRGAKIAQREAEIERAARRREERIAERIAEREREIARLLQEKEELARQYAERREERLAEALALQEQRLEEQEVALIAERETLAREQEQNRRRREERLAQRERLQSTRAAASVADPSVIASRRGRLFAYIGSDAVIYADVETDAWYAPYVSYVVEERIATGYADETGKPKGEFGVDNPVTVAEVLKMAMKAADTDLSGIAPPRNASARGTWAAAYVAKAEEMGLGVVTPDGNVHEPATRAEVVQTILEVLELPIASQEPRFSDVSLHHPYAHAIATAEFYGLITGDTDAESNPLGTFRPDDPINRAEVAKIIALVKEIMR